MLVLPHLPSAFRNNPYRLVFLHTRVSLHCGKMYCSLRSVLSKQMCIFLGHLSQHHQLYLALFDLKKKQKQTKKQKQQQQKKTLSIKSVVILF